MANSDFPRAIASVTKTLHGSEGRRLGHTPDQLLAWRIKDDLARSQRYYQGVISSKHVALLSALISFMKTNTRIVYAKNSTLRQRLHGIPQRTLGRQIKQLVDEGFLARRMSANGKRMKVETVNEENVVEEEYFGLDLEPFFARAQEFALKAEEARCEDARLESLRRHVSRLRDHLQEIDPEAKLLPEIARCLRKPPEVSRAERILRLMAMAERLKADLGPLPQDFEPRRRMPLADAGMTPEMAINDSQNGHHQQSLSLRIQSPTFNDGLQANGEDEKIAFDEEEDPPEVDRPEPAPERGSEDPCLRGTSFIASDEGQEPVTDFVNRILADFTRKLRDGGGRALLATTREVAKELPALRTSDGPAIGLPVVNAAGPEDGISWRSPETSTDLDTVIRACPEAVSMCAERPRSWRDLVEAAYMIGRAIGIGDRLLAQGSISLGRTGLAVTIFGLCERLDRLKSPGAYLRSLLSRPDFDPVALLS